MIESVINGNSDAAVAGMFLLAATLVSGTFLYFANRRKEIEQQVGKNLATEPIGQTAADIWFRRFERIERGQQYMMAILIGQGFGFLLFALRIRQEGVEGLHKINDKVDLVQMAVSQSEIRRR